MRSGGSISNFEIDNTHSYLYSAENKIKKKL